MRLRSGGHRRRKEAAAVISGLKKEALNTLLFSTENGGRRAQAQRDHMEAKEPWLRQLTLVKNPSVRLLLGDNLGQNGNLPNTNIKERDHCKQKAPRI